MKYWLTDSEIESLRLAQQDFMPEEIILRRRTYFGDGQFETTTLRTEVPARITPGFGFWRFVADRYQGVTPFTITVPADTEVRAGDQIVDSGSRTFEVRDVRAPSSFQTAKQVFCDLVTDG